MLRMRNAGNQNQLKSIVGATKLMSKLKEVQVEEFSKIIDLNVVSVRECNQALHDLSNDEFPRWKIENSLGRHAIGVGIRVPMNLVVDGHVGYYCAGMNKAAHVEITGNCGPGVAENMMSGEVHVAGSASQYAGATGHGGMLIIEGDASSRCGISMKGIDIIVKGSIGHMGAFMAQKGRLVVCGDAGDALGDSLYETRIYVRGSVASLGADCIEKEMRPEHIEEVEKLLCDAAISGFKSNEFRRYGSARKLYNFNIDNLNAY